MHATKKIGINLSDNSKPKTKGKINYDRINSSTEKKQLEMNKVKKSIIKTLLDNPNLAKNEVLDFFNEDDSFMKEFLDFLRSKENLTFPMILQAFEGKKQFLIDLAEDQNLIASEEAEAFILQAVNYLKKSNKEDLLSNLKNDLLNGSITSQNKIELKKLLMNKFENLNESEIKMLKDI